MVKLPKGYRAQKRGIRFSPDAPGFQKFAQLGGRFELRDGIQFFDDVSALERLQIVRLGPISVRVPPEVDQA